MNPHASIQSAIPTIRGERVILAASLAAIYGVQTKRLNEQVRRNSRRFPRDFVFRLTAREFAALNVAESNEQGPTPALRSQIATLKRGQHAK